MSEQYPRAALFGTEQRTLFSTIRGREYHLSIALPDSYKTSTQAYPVIYVLDGDFNFGVAAGLTRFSNWFRKVPGVSSLCKWPSTCRYIGNRPVNRIAS
jgi:hypothetical protein